MSRFKSPNSNSKSHPRFVKLWLLKRKLFQDKRHLNSQTSSKSIPFIYMLIYMSLYMLTSAMTTSWCQDVIQHVQNPEAIDSTESMPSSSSEAALLSISNLFKMLQHTWFKGLNPFLNLCRDLHQTLVLHGQFLTTFRYAPVQHTWIKRTNFLIQRNAQHPPLTTGAWHPYF